MALASDREAIGRFCAEARVSRHEARQNLALGNAADLVDEAAGCDSNVWQKNVFASASQSCIQ